MAQFFVFLGSLRDLTPALLDAEWLTRITELLSIYGPPFNFFTVGLSLFN